MQPLDYIPSPRIEGGFIKLINPPHQLGLPTHIQNTRQLLVEVYTSPIQAQLLSTFNTTAKNSKNRSLTRTNSRAEFIQQQHQNGRSVVSHCGCKLCKDTRANSPRYRRLNSNPFSLAQQLPRHYRCGYRQRQDHKESMDQALAESHKDLRDAIRFLA